MNTEWISNLMNLGICFVKSIIYSRKFAWVKHRSVHGKKCCYRHYITMDLISFFILGCISKCLLYVSIHGCVVLCIVLHVFVREPCDSTGGKTSILTITLEQRATCKPHFPFEIYIYIYNRSGSNDTKCYTA
jgi:hypothetical protein